MFKAPKTFHNFKIVHQDGTEVDFTDAFNVVVRSFTIDSPSPIIYHEKIQGKSGSIRLGKDYDNRTMRAVCEFFAVDAYDFPLLKNEILQALYQDEEFYIVRDVEPAKRWKVEVSQSFTPERIVNSGVFTIEFESLSPYSESFGSSLDPLTFDSELWQFGQGLLMDEVSYVHNTNNFQIYNAGDTEVNPRFMPLIISYRGASSGLKIMNETTSETWQYINGNSNTQDTISLDGVRSTKNNLSIVRNTNKKVITIAKGWNKFKLENTSGSYEIKFDFRFYYL